MKGKKLLFNLALITTAVMTCTAFAACGDDDAHGEDGHLHEAEVYQLNEREHWKECEICGDKYSRSKHNFKDGVCEVCGYYENYTEGLEYTEIYDEYEYIIAYSVKGIGTATDTDLRIPYFYNSFPVTYIEEAAFKDCEQLTSVVIPDTVTDTGYYVFQNCTNLKSAVIGDGLYQITFCVFDGCTSLTDVTIGNGVRIIGEWAFRNCTGLTEFYLPDSLTDLNGGAFDGSTNLVYTEYDNAQYLGSKTNPYMVLTKLNSKVIGSIDIPAGTKFINGDFSGCTNLTKLQLPEGVLSFARSAFANCTRLAEVSLPSTLVSIGSTSFQNCTALTQITIPESVKSIGKNAFSGCTNLGSVVFDEPEGWYYKTMLNVEKSTAITDNLSDTSVAANAVKSKYVGYFWLHD